MIGLTGAQGTGKTTLAKAFAQKQDIPVILTSTTQVMHSLGLDPAADYPLATRIASQRAILHAFERQYAHAQEVSPVFISDRTPLDLIAYMLADIQRTTVLDEPELAKLVTDYVTDCYAALNRFFATVLIVQPGLPIQRGREGKADACPAYMEHFNMIAKGSLNDDRCKVRGYLIPKAVLDLDARVKCVGNGYANAFERHTQEAAVLQAAGMIH